MYFYRTLFVLFFASLALSQLVDPGLPVTNPSVPGWYYGYNDAYNPMFQDLKTTPQLPTTADVTIIGGGWTGVSVAYYLSLFAPQLKVVLLDARGIGSGATGRNLGWMSPYSHNGFVSTVAKVGLAAAKQQIDFEDSVAEEVKLLSAVLGWTDSLEIEQDGQARIYRSAADWNTTLADVAAYRAAGYTDVTVYSGAQCNQMYGINDAVGCTKTSKAYKFRTPAFVWKLLEHSMFLNRKLNVQTNTPVLNVTAIKNAANPLLQSIPYLLQPFRPAKYNVVTSRGTIQTNTVVYATNGWVSHLLKNLQYGGSNANFVFPVSQPIIQTQIDPSGASQDQCIEFAPDQYGLQNRKSGSWIVAQGWNPFIADDSYNPSFDQPFYDDSLNFARTYFPKKSYLNIAHQWTGIQGFTSSGFPFVGPIGGQGPQKLFSNQFICAGMNGHGNPRAFGAARALVKEMVFGIVEPGFPTIYQTQLQNF